MTRAVTEATYQDNLAKVIWPHVKPQYYISETVKVYDNRVYKKVVTLPPPLPADSGKPTKPVYLNRDNLLNEVVIMPGISLEIFLSDDGGELLRMLEQNKHRILKARNVIQVFIETDNDKLSGNVMKTLVGRMDTNGIDYEGIIKPLYTNISDEDMNELLYTIRHRKGEIKKGIMKVIMAPAALPARLVSFELGLAIDLIEKLRISDNLWHPVKDPKKDADENTAIEDFTQQVITHIDTALDKISSISAVVGDGLRKGMGTLNAMLNKLGEKIGKIMDMLTAFRKWMQEAIAYTDVVTQMRIAFICGVWNGLVDMVTGLFFIVKLILDGVSGAVKVAEELVLNREMILEELDNILDQLGNIEWGEVFGAMREQMAGLPTLMEGITIAWHAMKQAPGIVANGLAAIPPQEWAYYIGYGLTFLIPVSAVAKVLGKVGEAGRAVGKLLLMAEAIIMKAFGIVVKLSKPAYSALAKLLSKIAAKMRQGTSAVKNMLAIVFRALREWIEQQIAKIVKLSEVLFDNAIMKVECFYKMVDKGLVKVYVLYYKNGLGAIAHTFSFISVEAAVFLQLANLALSKFAQSRILALERKGLEILRTDDLLYWAVKYKDVVIPIGSLDDLSELIRKIFKKETIEAAKKELDEIVRLTQLRRKALEEFTKKFGTVADDLWKHIGGEVKVKESLIDGKIVRKKRASGIHSYEDVIRGNVKIMKQTIPPNPSIDEPFLAFVQIRDPQILGNFINKGNSSLRFNGRQERGLTSMFPKNWRMERIQEEIAYAYKNMKKIDYEDPLIKIYHGKTTTGFTIELIFDDQKLLAAMPKI